MDDQDEGEEETNESEERFKDKISHIESGTHFENRYNLDELISKRFGDVARQVRKDKYEGLKRKRDLKR